MSSLDHKMMALIRERGLEVSSLTDADFRVLALEAMSTSQKFSAAKSVVGSAIRTQVIGSRATLPVIESRRAECAICPRHAILSDGLSGCLACGCSGRMLEMKWRDPRARCPENRWSNQS